MKRFFAMLVFCLFALPIDGAMTRVARVVDSRTLIVDGGASVTLRGVDVPPDQEALAADYLRALLANNAWVLVENGDVYRSPDALYVNGQLITRAYLLGPHMKYLGEAMPGWRAQRSMAPARRALPRTPPPRRPRRDPAPRRSAPRIDRDQSRAAVAPAATPATAPARGSFVLRKGGV